MSGEYSLGFIELNQKGEGKITIEDFGSDYLSLTIMPIAKNKTTGFTDSEPVRYFSWTASTREKEEQEGGIIPEVPNNISLPKPISDMSDQEVDALIAQVEESIAFLRGGSRTCTITQDLYFGMQNNKQVECLQEFLKAQGPDIYPEGLVTGNFYTLTQQAVIRFQEKYAEDILAPWGLKKGSGYVGPTTREKINSLLLE